MRTVDIHRWRFALVDDPHARAKAFDDRAWRDVVVPHDWSVELDFDESASSGTGYLPGGVGWYRAHVSLDEVGAVADQHVRLVFHGAYKNADVWVNGYHLGGRPSGYARFSFDLTEILSYAPDDDLVVAVRVEHTDLSDSRWYNGAGLNRGVELQVLEPVHLRDLGTTVETLSADADLARVRVRQDLRAPGLPDGPVQVQHVLRSLTTDDARTVRTDVALADGAAAVDVTIEVPSPQLWSDTTPHLYRLSTVWSWTAADGVERSGTSEDVVGLRTFAFDADHGFSVNGEPRTLRGVCLHDDAGVLGTAVPAAAWLRRLVALRAMGCNAVRMAHNPHGPELYALCDALGFFVIDEAFDEWENPKNKWWQGHNVYPPRHDGYAQDFPAWADADLAAMVDAHRNHPSIIAWSIGNEIDYPNDPYASPLFEEMTGNNDANKPAAERVYDPSRPNMLRLTTIARHLADVVRRLDPTRPVTLAAAFPELSSRTGLLGTVDLIGYNYKEHLYADDHLRFPDQPFVGSENGHGYAQWRAVVDNDFVAGQFLWTGIDYLGEARGWPVHGSGAGVLTLAGFEKHTYHLRRSWWSEEPVAYLVTRPHTGDEHGDREFWTHPVSRDWDAGAGEVEVLAFTNGDDLALRHGDQDVPLHRDDEHGYWRAVVTAGAAPLVLESRQGGEVVARDELTARGPAARIEARVWEASTEDQARCAAVDVGLGTLAQVECRLVDAEGRPAAGVAVVTASVVGGELLGLESGDLGDNTPYRADGRATLDGRVVVFVRCQDDTVVTLSAPGLPETRVLCDPTGRPAVAEVEVATT